MLEIGRGALVIVAGYAAMTVLVRLAEIFLRIAFPGLSPEEPAQAYVIGSLVAAFLAAALGGWVTARMAARRPLLHASILAAATVGVGLFLMTSEAREGEPAWYPAAIVVLVAAGIFAGGLIRARAVEPVHP